MKIDVKIRDEKLQFDINRETGKISALWSGKSDKYDHLTGEEILHSYQRRVIEQAKFTYSPLGKSFEKQRKTIEDQVEAVKCLKPKEDLKYLKPEENQELESIEGLLQKIWELMKSKIK